VAQLNLEHPCTSPVLARRTLEKSFTPRCSSSISYTNEYLAVHTQWWIYVYQQASRFNCNVAEFFLDK